MKFIYFISVLFLCANCGVSQLTEAEPEPLEEIWKMPIKATLAKAPVQTDPFIIENVTIIQNMMQVTISYSGGCKQHDFEAYGSTTIAKSDPAIRNMVLIHKANEDSCMHSLTRKINFNIEEMSYKKEKNSAIYLTIDGWKGKIKYDYFE
jgi:hypothetical protein